MRRRPRLDANHATIATAFERAGCSVQSLAPLGRGVPDLLVATRGITWAVEIKATAGRSLTADQVRWMRDWRGVSVLIASLDGVVAAVKKMHAQAARIGFPEPRGSAAAPKGDD